MNLRIVIGLAVSVSLQMLLGLLAASLFPPVPSGVAPVSTAVQAGVIALLSSTGGAFAARQPFMHSTARAFSGARLSSVEAWRLLAPPLQRVLPSRHSRVALRQSVV